jgi:hypothetical protein
MGDEGVGCLCFEMELGSTVSRLHPCMEISWILGITSMTVRGSLVLTLMSVRPPPRAIVSVHVLVPSISSPSSVQVVASTAVVLVAEVTCSSTSTTRRLFLQKKKEVRDCVVFIFYM